MALVDELVVVVVVLVVVVVTVTSVVVVVVVLVEVLVVVVEVAGVVACDEVLGPSEQGLPYARMACASWAYVHPSFTFESENPALHIMIPPKRSAVP